MRKALKWLAFILVAVVVLAIAFRVIKRRRKPAPPVVNAPKDMGSSGSTVGVGSTSPGADAPPVSPGAQSVSAPPGPKLARASRVPPGPAANPGLFRRA